MTNTIETDPQSLIAQNQKLLAGIELRQESLGRLSNYLSELESQLALIFAASPDIIVFVGNDGSIIKISDAATRILGYTKEEMIGKQLWSFVDDLDVERTQKLHNQVRKDLVCYFDGENSFVNSWKTKFGTKARLLWRYSVCIKNQIIGVATDITTFGTNAFYNLKMLQSAFDCTKDGILITDMTKQSQPIVYVNKAYEKMSGYSHEDLVGQPCVMLFNDCEEVKESRAFHTLSKAKESGETCDILLKTKRKNGTEFFAHILASAVIEQDVITNYIGIIRDVTDLIGTEYDWSPYAERGFCPIING